MTPSGFSWVLLHPQSLSEDEVTHPAFDFMNVKLKQQLDGVELDTKLEPLNQEELAKSSLDDRLDRALKELCDAVR